MINFRKNFLICIGAVAAVVLVIVFHMLSLQTNAAVLTLTDKIRQETEYTTLSVNTERGNIYDRSGYLLAGNTIAYTVLLDLNLSNGNGEFIAEYLAPILGIDEETIRKFAEIPYVEKRAVSVPIKNFASRQQIDQIDQRKAFLAERKTTSIRTKSEIQKNLNAVSYIPNVYRYYPNGSLASNIIGFFPFLNPSAGAAYGIESYFDDILSAETIHKKFALDPNIPEVLPYLPTNASIHLTIDRKIQSIAEAQIEAAVTHQHAKSGTIIIMDPETGEIQAMATFPRINLNNYSESSTVFTRDNRFNPAVMQPYEVGSVFKVFTLSIGLDSGAIKPNDVYNDIGTFDVDGQTIYNWNRIASGPQSITGCMAHSLNTCMSWIATEVGKTRFYEYLRAFHLNRPTGIELANEEYYPYVEPGDIGWTNLSLPNHSFGQGLMTTPIQMVKAIGAIANDGVMMQPHIVKAIEYEDHTEVFDPKAVGQPISAETARLVTEILTNSLEGEAEKAMVPGMHIAGKTGTGEIAIEGLGYVTDKTNASFVGWGPSEDPKFVAYTWLQEPTGNIWGSEVAAPLFADLMNEVMPYLRIPYDRQYANDFAFYAWTQPY